MTKRVYIDFESRSQCDIWNAGAYRYAEDSTTEILCLAWAIDNRPVTGAIYGHELKRIIPELNALIKEGAEFHAHNAFFERCIWKFCLTPIYGALPIPITQWRCTAAKVSANAVPRRLEHAALALGCKFQKDMEGSRLMRALCNTTGAIEETKLKRLLKYCMQDVEVERDIDRRLPDLCTSEQRVWFMDQYINDTGVRVDVQAIHNAIKLIDEETKNLNDELYKLTGGLVNAGTQRAAIKKYLESKGVTLPDLTKQTVKEALQNTDGSNFRVLQLRQQLSLTSNAKYAALEAAVSEDERVRDLLIYHGASTGRWSGKLVQIQNLVKANIPPRTINSAIGILKSMPEGFCAIYDVLPTLSSCIRGMFIPSLGCEMFTTDFAAIEARVVMWLAGEKGGLELFSQQDANPEIPDIYVHMARAIYNKLGITKADKKARQLGKQTVLGCGFGMGVKKFIETCAKYDIEVTDELANRAVMQYRKVFYHVPQFWYTMEDAAKKTISSGKPHTCGYITWLIDGEFLRMKLPSGRTLAYHHPKITIEGKITFMAVNSVTNKYEVEETWGGKLVENCLDKDTKVFTIEGCKRIIDVNQGDLIWDGQNWNNTGGCVSRGVKQVGNLAGILITPDHKILAGKYWKRAIDMDENTWREALKPGLSSVACALSKVVPETRASLFYNVLAAQRTAQQQETYFEEQHDVQNVGIKKQQKNANDTQTLCLLNWLAYGCTVILEWYRDVLTPRLKHTRITAGGILESIWFGFRTLGRFWNTQKHWKDGIKPIWTWTELKTVKGISRGICDLPPGKQALITAELQREYGIEEYLGPLQIFGKSFVLFGKAIMLSLSILQMAKHPKKLWQGTEEHIEVYDLINCGPQNRFTIITKDGPVIVHNCTQAVARDIMVESMFRLIKHKIRILFTVHDELVAEAPIGKYQSTDIVDIVREVPAWAVGCPINAECTKTMRYQK